LCGEERVKWVVQLKRKTSKALKALGTGERNVGNVYSNCKNAEKRGKKVTSARKILRVGQVGSEKCALVTKFLECYELKR
jgi:hypothetical protein